MGTQDAASGVGDANIPNLAPPRADRVLVIGGAGYVGSRLAMDLARLGYRVATLDERPLLPGADRRECGRYQELSLAKLRRYDWVLWFAGHSSVRIATADPVGTMRNNVSDLFELCQRLEDRQGFIYASSASVYTMPRPELCTEAFRPRELLNVYDQSKAWFDELMLRYGGRRWYGLRLGTVAGASAAQRMDTVFNAMTLDAWRKGVLTVRNEDVSRCILGLGDLVRAVDAIMRRQPEPGLYNLASFATTIGGLAHAVAERFGARIDVQPPTPGYNFRMSCAKFEGAAQFRFDDTVESLAAELVAAHGRAPAAMPALSKVA